MMSQSKPKYSLIADLLLRDIQEEKHPVGSFLPTESKLMRAYGVSRHTIRAAIDELKSRGAVVSRQGQGCKVISTGGHPAYAEEIQSIEELITFGQETRRELISHEIIEADEEIAEIFRCDTGRRLSRADMVRKALNSDQKIALVTLWVDALLDGVIEDVANRQLSAAEIIREKSGLKTNIVVQTIQADTLDAPTAKVLGADPGAPALVVTRCYAESKDGLPFLVARSICRADAFRVVSTFVASE